MPRTLPLDLVAHLRGRGSAPALVADGATLSYADLADRVAAMARELAGERTLVGLAMRNDVGSVVSYLGALAAGHAVVLAPACRLREVTAAIGPGLLIDGAGVTRTGAERTLHPDLALLLSTSGSTGSPKLVRLSYENLRSNAAAIAESLAIRPTDRAITTLPLHYTYGLSVLHSHLLAGAAVVLTDSSVTDPQFPQQLRGVTTLAGVPHTFELLERTGFPEQDYPALRTVTQAGGRMAPEAVRRWAELGQRRGFDFYVMYGQTEATARMLVLPPDLAARHPAAVGVPIPGGSVRIDPVADAGEGAGELVYRGANVMMGYAQDPGDLARGAELAELRTGDLARRTSAGLIEIVGRRSRFAKIHGLRVDLGTVERSAAEAGEQVWCLEGEECLLAACLGDPDAVRPVLCRAASLPPSSVVVRQVADVPRTAAGKPDYPALRERLAPEPEMREASAGAAGSVAAVLAAVLGRDPATIGPADSFVSLGGDSLSYVAAAAALERALGDLPPGWHLMPIADLQPAPARQRRWRTMDTSVVLRALAIVAIVGSHIGVLDIRGGAHLLIAIAGWNFARFRLATALPAPAELRAMLGSVARIVVPTLAWLGAVVIIGTEYGPTVLFGTNLFGPADRAPEWRYWYVEALVAVLLAAIALLALPGMHALHRRHPFGVALGALGATLLLHYPLTGEDGPSQLYTPVAVAWLFAAGWALAQARTAAQRLVVVGVVAAGLIGYFDDPARGVLVLAGIALVALRPSLPVPAPLVGILTALAAASLWIYLTHWQVYPPLESVGWLALLASLGFGVAMHRGEQWVRGRLRGRTARAVRASWAVRASRASRAVRR